jgi:hypothetical protein
MQLVRASLAAVEAVRSVDPGARIACAEPLIHVTTDSRDRAERENARGHHLAQFQAADMLTGRLLPELGGGEDRLDVVGVNYYPDNQWILEGPKLASGHPLYRPLRDLLADAWQRYRRPLLITETGAEGEARPEWLRFVAREVHAALAAGVPVLGVCLYPILDYPGWDDDRHCPAGLWGFADAAGEREIYQPLADELARQQWLLAREQPAMTGVRDTVQDANATILQGV